MKPQLQQIPFKRNYSRTVGLSPSSFIFVMEATVRGSSKASEGASGCLLEPRAEASCPESLSWNSRLLGLARILKDPAAVVFRLHEMPPHICPRQCTASTFCRAMCTVSGLQFDWECLLMMGAEIFTGGTQARPSCEGPTGSVSLPRGSMSVASPACLLHAADVL